MKLYLRQRLISPLIDLSYIAMSFIFSKHTFRWYEHLNTWYYQRQAHLYDENIIQADELCYAQALEAGLNAIAFQPHTILDVNTGTGFAALRLKELFPKAEIGATDLSEEMLKRARYKADKTAVPITFVRADVANLPFADEAFDLVTLHNGPPNFPEMARVLRPNGQMLIAFTSGARVPHFLVHRWLRQAQSFGRIETGRSGDGLWIVIRKQ